MKDDINCSECTFDDMSDNNCAIILWAPIRPLGSSSSSPSSYSHFYAGSMYDDRRLRVARPYISR